MQWRNIKYTIFAVVFFAIFSARPVAAYAPNVTGKVTQNTGAPLTGLWIQWDSYESGDAGNTSNKGDHNRYAGSDEKGSFSFKSWDSEGVENKGGLVYSNVGKREYNDKINLDYDDANGKEARRSDTNLYDIFNCHNELNSFTLKLPDSMAGAKVQARWRRDSNNTTWSEWQDNKVSLPKDEFTNSHDYQVEFKIDLPKKASIRDLDTEIKTSQLLSLNTKVPACLKVDLCTEGGKECSDAAKQTPGVHRVVLAGVGEIQRKLTIGNESKPVWVVECVQRGSAENPQYMCTTGNSQLDNEVFKKDNFSTLRNEMGYSSRIFYSDGKTETSPKITNANRQDVYEWETKINVGKKLVSVFMAMYEPENTLPPQSGNQPSQIQATLSNEEGCRLIVDPYGRVYDSYTFEPLNNASVNLSKKTATGTYTSVQQGDVIGNLINPITTGNSGTFSFIVPPGTYRLDATRSGYKPYQSADIVQTTAAQKADIPMEPLDRAASAAYAKGNKITFESIFQKRIKSGDTLRIEGVVSHPQATITVYSQKIQNGRYIRSANVGSTTATLDGQFSVLVPFSKLGKNEIIGEIEAAKKGNPSVKTILLLEPLLNGVEGFAVNQAGAPIANANVGLYLLNSDSPSYEAKADARGYFSIPENSVPEISYEIRTSGNKQITARNFLVYNAALGSTNNVFAQAAKPNQNVLGANDYQTSQAPVGNMTIIATVLGIFIFTATALLGVYILQQKKTKRRRR